MIESITVKGVASFGAEGQVLDGLSKFNFLFGSNGVGKTTISRVIDDLITFPACTINWKGGTKMEAMVYNRDFVERNFHMAAELKGIFTLGERQKDVLDKIAAGHKDVEELTEKIEKLGVGLRSQDGTKGKKVELAALEVKFKEKCWSQKQKHDAKLQGPFTGVRNNADRFKEKVLTEYATNTASLVSLSDLEKKSENLFGQTPVIEALVPIVDTTKLLVHESNPILKKKVIGKEDVDIAAMIGRLGNSDWVRAGRGYLDANDKTCPFCQQKTNDAFVKSLNEYFDETFIADSKAIDELSENYSVDASALQQQLGSIIASPSRFLDLEKIKSEKDLLDTKIVLNKQRIATKKAEPSQSIGLESLGEVAISIKELVDAANEKVGEHNRMVSNLANEKKALTDQVWRFVLEELKTDFSTYEQQKIGLDKSISSMEQQVIQAEAEKEKRKAEIRELEKQTTSIQPTVDAINALLSSFGFNSFKLKQSEHGTSYELVRADGSNAKATLSEGEKTFVTFLYFYHLLKGSTSESGMTTNRVVVFDDPVSSLDSEILFIVSSLIRGLFDEARVDAGNIKQIFVMTHNVYFHKEITYNHKRQGKALVEETFWVVRKHGVTSKIEKHSSNPIRTSYDLLWEEIRRPDRSVSTIQNTLRRILENYFKILGGIDLHKLCEKFVGQEKLICKSLVSWINDGSHFAHDDLCVASDDAQVETYLKIFEEIFKKADHHAHYRMMMGIQQEETAPA